MNFIYSITYFTPFVGLFHHHKIPLSDTNAENQKTPKTEIKYGSHVRLQAFLAKNMENPPAMILKITKGLFWIQPSWQIQTSIVLQRRSIIWPGFMACGYIYREIIWQHTTLKAVVNMMIEIGFEEDKIAFPSNRHGSCNIRSWKGQWSNNESETNRNSYNEISMVLFQEKWEILKNTYCIYWWYNWHIVEQLSPRCWLEFHTSTHSNHFWRLFTSIHSTWSATSGARLGTLW